MKKDETPPFDQSHKKTSMVVTSVLKNQNEVLVLRRSMKVKTMQEKWAGVSGYLEKNEDLLSRALIEIYEETRINKDELILRKIFNQFGVQIHNELMIIIQPFCFVSNTRNVVLDWEHSDYYWMNKKEMDNFEFVPRLKQIISRCFEEL
ncbi:dihydroneopterin triphosphate pyrophosphatase [Candidatus Nitrosocosmicus oleophilus]|jgi:8-oxo-dGTP diphosphatase|uniref:Dihydroneopterin triphosphate pyrophosphatase n=1 Tax=Candidatus Nitrosocosmicus oleophilus TaxID=1353260 RepID=A0A654M209_9ARCH|nr:NUDIX domain-containing protein [Candidatus Nitrosocosmicus oleophilus]ALI37485.1 dihydroneopterin triphosphate pyrophosphatase [Candidatus Nitrosocosmicus oleophilus]